MAWGLCWASWCGSLAVGKRPVGAYTDGGCSDVP